MGTLKYKVGSAMASATLLLAPVAPVAASENNAENSYNNTTTNTVTTTTDNSKSIEIGDCVVMMDDIKVWLDQYNQQNNGQANVDTDLDGGGYPQLERFDGPRGGGDDGNTTNQSNSSSQSQANGQSVVITVAPDCSVTNVQQAVSSGGGSGDAVQGASAEAGKGGVGAGFGGVASSLAASVGAVGSVLGAGLGLRRFGK